MSKKKSRIKISDKVMGIITGVAITLVAIGVISAISVSSAHTNSGANNMMNGNAMPMMHEMMVDSDTSMGGCVSMHGSDMTEEEIEEMLRSVDKDGDGICDMCGMPIETCRRMMLS